MARDSAIPKEQKMPDGYRQMAKTVCTECGAWYLIIHEHPFADADRARRQQGVVAKILGGEHHDKKFERHLGLYDNLDPN
jgi:hypothetical protein